MKKHFTTGLFILILCLAAGIRLWKITTIPTILNRDEAALAYNAYLLKETGFDEWQRSWPLALESFGDYKLPGYPALVVISMTVLGDWQDWVVRLPAVIAGISLVAISYFLAKQWQFKEYQAATVAAFIAFQPHFIFYSRIAYEAVVGLALFLVMLMIVSRKKGSLPVQIVLTLLFAFAGGLTYNTPLLLLPFCIVVLPLWQGLPNWKRWLPLCISLAAVFVVLWIPLSQLTTQKSGITLFGDELTHTRFVEYRGTLTGVALRTLGNYYVYHTGLILNNIGASFSPDFLVTNGGAHPWHSLPNWGHFWWLVYGLGLLGIAGTVVTSAQLVWKEVILASYTAKKLIWPTVALEQKVALLLLLIISLAPSVVTVDAPHTTRSLLFLFLWCFMAAAGLELGQHLLTRSTQGHSKGTRDFILAVATGLVLVAGSYEFGLTWKNYFIYYPDNYSESLRVGYDQILTEVEKQFPTQPIAVVDPAGFHYILTAWYTQMPAATYFDSVIRQQPDRIGFRYGQQVGRYHFIGNSNDRDPATEKIVVEWSETKQVWEVREL
jgi:4-amino-4-deoxy-L-arabinose transferase-like glycosyltransferase